MNGNGKTIFLTNLLLRKECMPTKEEKKLCIATVFARNIATVLLRRVAFGGVLRFVFRQTLCWTSKWLPSLSVAASVCLRRNRWCKADRVGRLLGRSVDEAAVWPSRRIWSVGPHGALVYCTYTAQKRGRLLVVESPDIRVYCRNKTDLLWNENTAGLTGSAQFQVLGELRTCGHWPASSSDECEKLHAPFDIANYRKPISDDS